MKTPETRETVLETNYNKHEMHTTAQDRTKNMLRTETQTMKQVYQASFNQIQPKPIQMNPTK